MSLFTKSAGTESWLYQMYKKVSTILVIEKHFNSMEKSSQQILQYCSFVFHQKLMEGLHQQ